MTRASTPAIASEFSAAAFRVGHTMLSPNLLLVGADGQRDQMSLARSFSNTSFVVERGISEILRGLAAQRAIISDQFLRLRDGDRFWFENDPYFLANPGLLDQVRSTTLADIIRRNTPIGDEIQDDLFIIQEDLFLVANTN